MSAHKKNSFDTWNMDFQSETKTRINNKKNICVKRERERSKK